MYNVAQKGRELMKEDLTYKQKLFVEEYLKDFNGTRAYRLAYNTVKNDDTAAAAASRLLTNVKIKAYMDHINNAARNTRILTIEQIKEFYSNVVISEESDLQQRISAADKLSRYVGMNLYEAAKKEYDIKRLELETKRLELLIQEKQGNDDESNTGVVMIPSLDLESYEREKEEFLKGLDTNG